METELEELDQEGIMIQSSLNQLLANNNMNEFVQYLVQYRERYWFELASNRSLNHQQSIISLAPTMPQRPINQRNLQNGFLPGNPAQPLNRRF